MPEQQEGRQNELISKSENKSEKENRMKTIDKAVLEDYNSGSERGRLRTDLGLIEFERTKELLLETLPRPPAVIYDIGGGYGEYAWLLASWGYEVHLFDLSETNIRMSAELSAEYPSCALKASEVADAREIGRPDKSADAVLLMGPLYHITDKSERLLALEESRRLLRDGGVLYTAAITPYATLLWATTVYGVKNLLLEEAEFMEMVERELADGSHIKPTAGNYRGIGNSHFHSAAELRSAGFENTDIHGVVGAAWLAPDIDELWKHEKSREALMRTVRLLDGHEDIIGLSTHILGISRK